jgi:hypothetical protein
VRSQLHIRDPTWIKTTGVVRFSFAVSRLKDSGNVQTLNGGTLQSLREQAVPR